MPAGDVHVRACSSMENNNARNPNNILLGTTRHIIAVYPDGSCNEAGKNEFQPIVKALGAKGCLLRRQSNTPAETKSADIQTIRRVSP